MAAAFSDSSRFCTFERHTPGWQIGTGLRISLAPGKYCVTADEQIDGRNYLMLNHCYRVDADSISE